MKRILVIDDEIAILQALEEALIELGYAVKTLPDPKHLSREIEVFRPDLLLLDFMLNNSNGGAICHQLKSQPETANLPVIMMSGYNEVSEFAEKSGCDAFIKKPFDLSELNKRLHDCLNNDVQPA